MLKLVDGPCEGTYMCKRAPVFLRAVKDKGGPTDVLDLIGDTPKANESVYVYQLEGEPGIVHLNFGGGKGGFYALGTYRYLPDVDGEKLRHNAVWQKWAREHAKSFAGAVASIRRKA